MFGACTVYSIGGHCGWPQCLGPAPCTVYCTWCRPQTLRPATMAPYPSPTQYNHQFLTANGTTRLTTSETINPLPVNPLTPTLQEDLHCQGNHQLLVELPARIGQIGTPPLKQPPFVECTCFEHVLCSRSELSVCACTMYIYSYLGWGSLALVLNLVTCPIGIDCGWVCTRGWFI